jgi:Trm5-related predicted tRNA methylase
MSLYEDVVDLYEKQEELRMIKEEEMTLRKKVAAQILGNSDKGEAEKVTRNIEHLTVTVQTTELLSIDDPQTLVDWYLFGNLNREESAALSIKPDVTLARMKKVNPDSKLWRCMSVKLSPTPTVTIKEQ